ncbi:hypothetical protein ABT095_26005 [Kitasatospora sp. NPDC002227]|uniref:hypothetical protein n=1 Tax=Kitasatospora sp. NPDC002227 TaxID=3154773 RepID=UPI00332919DB
MIGFVLVGVLALTLGGCACVLWAERGGPRWARAVAATTLAAGELLRVVQRDRRRRLRRGDDNSSGDTC